MYDLSQLRVINQQIKFLRHLIWLSYFVHHVQGINNFKKN